MTNTRSGRLTTLPSTQACTSGSRGASGVPRQLLQHCSPSLLAVQLPSGEMLPRLLSASSKGQGCLSGCWLGQAAVLRSLHRLGGTMKKMHAAMCTEPALAACKCSLPRRRQSSQEVPNISKGPCNMYGKASPVPLSDSTSWLPPCSAPAGRCLVASADTIKHRCCRPALKDRSTHWGEIMPRPARTGRSLVYKTLQDTKPRSSDDSGWAVLEKTAASSKAREWLGLCATPYPTRDGSVRREYDEMVDLPRCQRSKRWR